LPSLLRLTGLAIAILVIALAIAHRRRGASRGLFFVEMAGGIGLLVVVALPDSIAAVQEFLGISDQPFSRLITVLLVSTGLLFGMVVLALSRAERASTRVTRLIRALSVAQVEHDAAAGRLGGILICIPAYNEEGALPGVLAEIPKAVVGLDTHVLVIDDASRDSTRRVAERHGARVVSQPVNGGQGAALQTGYLVAERLGVDIVVTLDADGQHDPAELARLVQPIVAGQADFVVGSRRMGAYDREHGSDAAARNMGITVFTQLINVLGGTDVTDVANGYRAIRASRLAEIVFTEDQFHNPELLMGAARAGLRILDVPVTIRRRTAGHSKKGGTLRYGLGFLAVIIRSWLREPTPSARARDRATRRAGRGRPADGAPKGKASGR
jgi:hypothetical protein